MKTIPLSRGKVALVDDSDYEWLNQRKWSAGRRPEKNTVRWYAIGRKEGRLVAMHRELLGVADPKIQIDHENGDGLDNQKTNLRIATPAQNQANRHKPPGVHSSRHKGVCWDRARNKWHCSIKVSQRKINLGRFDSESDAALAYNAEATKLFGNFARLNVVV